MKSRHKTLLYMAFGVSLLLLSFYTNQWDFIEEIFPEISKSVTAGVP